MNKETFLKVVNNVKEITDNDLEDLRESSKFHPYCQNIHILIAKKYHDLQHGLAPAKLHKAAIFSPDRFFLKRIIEDDPSLKKFTKKPTDFPQPVSGTETSESTENIQEEIPPQNVGETSLGDIPSDSISISEKDAESTNEAIGEVFHATEPAIDTSSPESDQGGLKEEIVEEKDNIHAELEKNLKEYKENRQRKVKENLEKVEESKENELQQQKPESLKTELPAESDVSEDKYEKEEIADAQIEAKKNDGQIDASEEKAEENSNLDQQKLIEDFIKLNPSLSRFDLKFDEDQKQLEDLSIPKLTIGEHLISENLAVILQKQGKIQKALNIYEKLILKFPEKKAYFASCIEKIKNP